MSAGTHITHTCLIHHGNLWRKHTVSRTNTVESDQTDLILQIELVLVISVEQHLQQGQLRVDGDRLELPGLESRSFIGVEREESKLLKLDLVQGETRGTLRLILRIESEELDFAGDFRLVR